MRDNSSDDRQRLINWFEREFIRRALAVKQDEGPLHWVPVGTRVSWTEILHQSQQMGVDLGGIVDARLWWHEHRNWETWTNRTDRMTTERLKALLAKLES